MKGLVQGIEASAPENEEFCQELTRRRTPILSSFVIRAVKPTKEGCYPWPDRRADAGARISAREATFYKWRQKYGGLDVPETRRLWELEFASSACWPSSTW